MIMRDFIAPIPKLVHWHLAYGFNGKGRKNGTEETQRQQKSKPKETISLIYKAVNRTGFSNVEIQAKIPTD